MANLQLIKDLAEKRKISVRDLAERVGLKENQIHVMCRSNSTKIDTLEKIARVLDVPISYFFDEDITITERYEQNGDHNLQAHRIDKYVAVDRRGNSKGAGDESECSVAVLQERIRSLEAIIAEKNERIAELKERVEELKRK